MPDTATLFSALWSRLTPEEKIQAMKIVGIKSRSSMNAYIKNPGQIKIDCLNDLLPFLSKRFNTEVTWQDLLSDQNFESFISKAPQYHG